MNDSYAVSKQCINSWENMHMKCRRIRKQIVHATELYDFHAASSALILGGKYAYEMPKYYKTNSSYDSDMILMLRVVH